MTLYLKPERQEPWFDALDGRHTTTKAYDERKDYSIDFSDRLSTGETITAVAWELGGPTSHAQSNTTTTVTISMSGTGTGKLTVTTSAARKLVEYFRWVGVDGDVKDYP
jgi:hypothetical protein